MDGRQEALRDDLKLAVMSPLSEDKLLSLLAEIRSDIRQIKTDLQALQASALAASSKPCLAVQRRVAGRRIATEILCQCALLASGN